MAAVLMVERVTVRAAEAGRAETAVQAAGAAMAMGARRATVVAAGPTTVAAGPTMMAVARATARQNMTRGSKMTLKVGTLQAGVPATPEASVARVPGEAIETFPAMNLTSRASTPM